MQSNLFPTNTRSNFETFIHPQDLSYISSSEIEVAIKSITFDSHLDSFIDKEHVLGLKSNITFHTISSYGYDQIVSIFTVNSRKHETIQLQFFNPTFFPTNHEKLSKSSFKIVDLKTGQAPNFAIASPTFLEVVVRSRVKRMKQPFHIFLDSSCEESKKRFIKNTNTDFCIQLPQRMEFQKDWMLCLKSIHFSNCFYSMDECWLSIVGYKPAKPKPSKWKIQGGLNKKVSHDLSKIIKTLNKVTKGYIRFEKSKSGSISILLDENYDKRTYGASIQVTFSTNLKKILGLDRSHLIFSPVSMYTSSRKPDVFALNPHHFIVCCDLVEESILGGQLVQILKYFPRTSKTKSVDVEFAINDYLKLNLKNFDRIRIRLTDLSGNTINNDDGDTPTRLQLLFVNMNNQ